MMAQRADPVPHPLGGDNRGDPAQTRRTRLNENRWRRTVRKNAPRIPDLVPTLGAGKHRTPRKGACFMEMASYLAGERWSDQPRCTHPLLAELAREVNDHVADDNRQRLVPLVPSVIGMTSDDPHV